MATATQPQSTDQMTSSSIRVYNTLTRQKEPFEPVSGNQVGIYLCGPTVYKEAHIGHMVGPVIFDCITRYLNYNAYEVTWVVNITDVDDKLIAQSQARGVPMEQIAIEMTMDYCANLLALGVDQITHMPRATENMHEIIRFIAELVEKNFAYAAEGDVFFDVAKDPQYGKLSNRRADEQQGEGGGAAARKRSAGDFALWKGAKPGEPAWESPWGPGRPGWHIECSAMSRRILGRTFDIHGGGLDLIFPHHENEIAQSECCHGISMAKYWMHNGLMRRQQAGKIGGRAERDEAAGADAATSNLSECSAGSATAEEDKISRSKGAGGLRDLIAEWGGQQLRFFLLRTHYRSTILFSDEALAEAATALERFTLFFDRYQRILGRPFYLDPDAPDEDRRLITRRAAGEFDPGDHPLLREVHQLRQRFLAKMDDDFNSGAAVSELFQLLTALNKYADRCQLEDASQRQQGDLEAFGRAVETLRELGAVLGLFLSPPAPAPSGADEKLTAGLIELLIQLRAAAREKKDFATADRIRDGLSALGVALEDRKGETGWRID